MDFFVCPSFLRHTPTAEELKPYKQQEMAEIKAEAAENLKNERQRTKVAKRMANLRSNMDEMNSIEQEKIERENDRL